MSGRRVALVGVGVVMAALYPLAIVLSLTIGETFVAAWNAGFAFYAVLGLLILWSRPGNTVGRLFLMLGLVVPLAAIAAAYAQYRLPGGEWAAWLSSMSNPIVFGSLLVFLPLLFPTGSFVSRGWRRFGIFAAALLGAMAVLFALTPGPLDCCPGLRNPMDIPALGWLRGALEVGFPVVALSGLVAFASLVIRYRRARDEERLQIKWFAFAMAAILLAAVVGALASIGVVGENDVAPLIVFPSGIAAIAIAVGIAILRYRLYDIDVVINKTLVYGALAAFITAVYVGIVVGLGALLGSEGEPNLGLQVAATALVAVAFQPARARVQHLANRLVYGRRATPYEVMAAFAERMAASLEISEVLPRMAEAAARGVRASRARVRLFLPGGEEREATWPEEATSERFPHALPVVHRGEQVGELSVARPPGDHLPASEEALLQDLAAQGGLALHNVRLTEELRSHLEEISARASALRDSQRRLLTAGDDERRRFERAIEEGPERRLEEMASSLRAALSRLEEAPQEAAASLERLQEEAREALEGLRDLARGIYPPLLADKGLSAALEAQARKAPLPVEVEADGVSRYPQDVEAGVYFCVVEGLRQAARRGASRTRVRLGEEDGGLVIRLEIGGVPETSDAGVGLGTVRDRIEALEGTVEVTADGTASSVIVRLPVAEQELG